MRSQWADKSVRCRHRQPNRSQIPDAGPGFGGSCFQKDILNLVSPAFRSVGGGGLLGERGGVEHLATAPHWHAWWCRSCLARRRGSAWQYWFAFKANTNDTRATSIDLSRSSRSGRSWPFTIPRSRSIKWHGSAIHAAPQLMLFVETAGLRPAVEDAVMGADAVLLLTEWQHYRELNCRICRSDAQAAWVFDARSVAELPRSKPQGSVLRVGEGRVDGTHCFSHRSCGFYRCLSQSLSRDKASA